MQIYLHYGATLVWLVSDSPSRHIQSIHRAQYGCCLRPVYDQVGGTLVEGLEKNTFQMRYLQKMYHFFVITIFAAVKKQMCKYFRV